MDINKFTELISSVGTEGKKKKTKPKHKQTQNLTIFKR